MDTIGSGAFGPNFMPGKVEADNSAASQALRMRWSGMPAHASETAGGERPINPTAMDVVSDNSEVSS